MTISKVNLAAVTRAERKSVITSASEAVQACAGWIDDVNFFSNLSIAIRCYVPSAKATLLGERLEKIGLSLDGTGRDALARATAENEPASELLCFLSITFFHDEPDMRQIVPSVPG